MSIGIPQHLAAFGRASPKHPPILKALVYGEDLVAAPSCKLFDSVKGAESQFVFIRRYSYELRRMNLGAAHLCRLRRRCGLPCQNSSSKSFL